MMNGSKINNLQINVRVTLSDFANYTYVGGVSEPQKHEKSKPQYIFPTKTCLDGRLIPASYII